MPRCALKLSAVLLVAYIALHLSLEFDVLRRGIGLPTPWDLLEWALTFPLSIWQFLYGLPNTIVGRLIYYALVVVNAFAIGFVINRDCYRKPKQLEAEQAGAGQSATRCVVEPEGGVKPKPESERRFR